MNKPPTHAPAAIPRPGEGKRGPEGYLAYLLRQAAAAARLAIERALADLGTTQPQFMVLTMLDAYPGASGADIARLSQLTPQTVNLIIRNLERAGAVAKADHPAHGRVLQLSLTDDGRTLLAACKARVSTVTPLLNEGLSAQEEAVIRAWLVRLAVKLG
jgi:DNA-binding MarR family transcriptional regulator